MAYDVGTDEKKKLAFAYINEYQKKKYDRITILRKIGEKKRLEEIAAERDMSLTQFINMCIDEKLSRDGLSIL